MAAVSDLAPFGVLIRAGEIRTSTVVVIEEVHLGHRLATHLSQGEHFVVVLLHFDLDLVVAVRTKNGRRRTHEVRLVDIGEVACVEPSVGDRLSRCFRFVEVAANHVGTPNPQFANLAAGAIVSVLVDDSRLHHGKWWPHAAGAVDVEVCGVEADHTGRLGQPVAGRGSRS